MSEGQGGRSGAAGGARGGGAGGRPKPPPDERVNKNITCEHGKLISPR